MSNIPQHIQEQIEREYPINEPRQWMSAEQSASYMERQISIQKAALRGAEIALESIFNSLSRIEVIDNNGRQFVKYFNSGCSVDFQDNYRTMKIFINQPLPTPPNE